MIMGFVEGISSYGKGLVKHALRDLKAVNNGIFDEKLRFLKAFRFWCKYCH
jgi:hypothetical protein